MKFEYYNTHHSKAHNAQIMCDLFAFVGLIVAGVSFFLLKSKEFGELAITLIIGGALLFTLMIALKAIVKSLALSNYYKFMQVYPQHLEPLDKEELSTE